MTSISNLRTVLLLDPKPAPLDVFAAEFSPAENPQKKFG